MRQVLRFWFGRDTRRYDDPAVLEARVQSVWFTEDPELDRKIERSFLPLLESVTEASLSFLETPEEKLGAIILLDQLPRNMFRNRPRSFAYDGLALGLARQMVSAGQDRRLRPVGRVFVYLPLEHSEEPQDQRLWVAKFSELHRKVRPELQRIYGMFLDYAIRHQEIIDRFGRFPHRNHILGRSSTPEESEFLTQPGSSF
jgi:uncharacterized protein (DUF924 family)